tara:strand:+ start:1101 stop:1259 length:159 start_codon:yes stop_codon:yes gene_type:complete
MAEDNSIVSFYIPDELLRELNEFVDNKRLETDRSRSSWLVLATRELLKNHKK